LSGTLAFPVEFGGDKCRDIFGPEFNDRILHPLNESADDMCARVIRQLERRSSLRSDLRDDANRRRQRAKTTEATLKRLLADVR
jgi:hypothetical protein